MVRAHSFPQLLEVVLRRRSSVHLGGAFLLLRNADEVILVVVVDALALVLLLLVGAGARPLTGVTGLL